MIYLVYILWIIYSSLEVYRESSYWYMKKSCISQLQSLPIKNTEHGQWFIQRILVGVIITLLLFNEQYSIYSLLYLIGLGLSFPIWHDGFYYIGRNKIKSNTYPDGFMDYSLTSSAEMTFNFCTRMILFIIGLIFCIFTTYLLK